MSNDTMNILRNLISFIQEKFDITATIRPLHDEFVIDFTCNVYPCSVPIRPYKLSDPEYINNILVAVSDLKQKTNLLPPLDSPFEPIPPRAIQ